MSAAPAITPPPSVDPIELTVAEKAALEAERVKLGLAAEKEWAEYLAAGVVRMDDLVHFWDVSFSDVPLLLIVAI